MAASKLASASSVALEDLQRDAAIGRGWGIGRAQRLQPGHSWPGPLRCGPLRPKCIGAIVEGVDWVGLPGQGAVETGQRLVAAG